MNKNTARDPQVFEEEGATSGDCWSIAGARILPMATQHYPRDGPIAIGSESRNGNAARDRISGLQRRRSCIRGLLVHSRCQDPAYGYSTLSTRWSYCHGVGKSQWEHCPRPDLGSSILARFSGTRNESGIRLRFVEWVSGKVKLDR
jgi:hypothetical protein